MVPIGMAAAAQAAYRPAEAAIQSAAVVAAATALLPSGLPSSPSCQAAPLPKSMLVVVEMEAAGGAAADADEPAVSWWRSTTSAWESGVWSVRQRRSSGALGLSARQWMAWLRWGDSYSRIHDSS